MSINKIAELTGLRKILAKDRGAMEEPLRLPNGGLTRTPEEALGVFLESHFPGNVPTRTDLSLQVRIFVQIFSKIQIFGLSYGIFF